MLTFKGFKEVKDKLAEVEYDEELNKDNVYGKIKQVLFNNGSTSDKIRQFLKPQGALNVINYLFKIEVKEKTYYYNVLQIASIYGYYNIVKNILSANLKDFRCDSGNQTIRNKKTSKIRKVKLEKEVDVDIKSLVSDSTEGLHSSDTALICAAKNGHVNIAKLLVNHGAKLNGHIFTNDNEKQITCEHNVMIQTLAHVTLQVKLEITIKENELDHDSPLDNDIKTKLKAQLGQHEQLSNRDCTIDYSIPYDIFINNEKDPKVVEVEQKKDSIKKEIEALIYRRINFVYLRNNKNKVTLFLSHRKEGNCKKDSYISTGELCYDLMAELENLMGELYKLDSVEQNDHNKEEARGEANGEAEENDQKVKTEQNDHNKKEAKEEAKKVQFNVTEQKDDSKQRIQYPEKVVKQISSVNSSQSKPNILLNNKKGLGLMTKFVLPIAAFIVTSSVLIYFTSSRLAIIAATICAVGVAVSPLSKLTHCDSVPLDNPGRNNFKNS